MIEAFKGTNWIWAGVKDPEREARRRGGELEESLLHSTSSPQEGHFGIISPR